MYTELSPHDRKLLCMAPAVWFLAELHRGSGWRNDRERITAAAKDFRNLSCQEARDCEAIGRALGVALGVLNTRDLPPLDKAWSPDWLTSLRDESQDELDWMSLFGFVSRIPDWQE